MAAIALTLGAIPLAAGRDLSGGVSSAHKSLRARKRPRSTAPPRPIAPAASRSRRCRRGRSRCKLDGLADTSVLIRVPVAQAARPSSFAPSWTKSGAKRTVACEPVVSVLTEVAKLLQPGRCVT